ncbi:MAG TPA: hypothetical protein VHO66_06220 [Ruminiclostridium sp.]|nr:hypothetical protein [Ruminiclostridium sp.]
MGIGTLNEHSLHAFLKDYYQKDTTKQEIKMGRYVADIVNDSGIIEIQTRGFSKLKPKLEYFLLQCRVTVVYPIAKTKHLVWVDPEVGEATKPRLSPKTGAPFEIFYELCFIKDFLCRENLSFKIILMDIVEYRFLDGWSRDRKKGSTRKDSVPVSVFKEVEIKNKTDFLKLLPSGLPRHFTLKELMKKAKASRTLARRAIDVLCYIGVIEKCGKSGREYLYEIYIER